MDTRHPSIKSAELTVRRPRSESEARSYHLPIGKHHAVVLGIFGIESQDETVREQFFQKFGSELEHMGSALNEKQNPARVLEKTLARLNEGLGNLGGSLSLRPEKCHAVVALLIRGQLFLAGFGNLLALFLHKTADRRFSIYELHTQFSEQPPTWEKLFSSVLDGDLHEGDIFYVATHIPQHVLSLSELQDMLVTLPPQGALERLEGFIPPAIPFAGVTAHILAKDTFRSAPRMNPMGSLELLNKTQDRTAELLGEQRSAPVTTVIPEREKLQWLGRQEASAAFMKAFTFVWHGLQQGGVVVFEYLKKGGGAAYQAWSQRKKRGARHSSEYQSTPEKASFVMRAKKASASPLGVLLLVGALAIAGIGSFFIFGTNTEEETRQVTFTTTVQIIEEKISSIEASLIYRNTIQAKQDLTAALTAWETLTPKTDNERRQAENLRTSLATLQQKSLGITPVTPTVIATMPSGEALNTATAIGTQLFGTSTTLGVYRLNSLEKTWTKETFTNGVVGTPRIAAAENATSALFIDATQRLGRLSTTNSTLNPLASGVDGLASAEDLTAYNDTLYILTAKGQQVVKMRPQADGYEAGTLWITSLQSDLTKARALAIDGTVYILTDSTIKSFFSGREQTWQAPTFDPPLSNPIDLFTNTDTPYLYILDPGSTRVIVIKKADGGIVAQYVSDMFATAIAFSVDETANLMTVVTTTQALQFTPTHLVE